MQGEECLPGLPQERGGEQLPKAEARGQDLFSVEGHVPSQAASPLASLGAKEEVDQCHKTSRLHFFAELCGQLLLLKWIANLN